MSDYQICNDEIDGSLIVTDGERTVRVERFAVEGIREVCGSTLSSLEAEVDKLKKDRDGWQQLCISQHVTYMEHIKISEDENAKLRDLANEQSRLVDAVHAYWSGGRTFKQFSDVFKAIARVTLLAAELGIGVPE